MTAVAHDQHLAQAADYLRAAAEGEKPLLDGALGLRSLFNSLASGQPLDPQLAGEVSRLLFAAAPRIAEVAAGRLAPEYVFVALGCASAAMGNVDAERLRGLMAFAAILEAEIRALFLRDMIAAGGQADLADALSRNPVIAAPYSTDPATVH
ncbi:hypothetical protein [Ollibium composti]|uniref:Uncharacterized protein n=1 Tax=Ollibium composti TaxID=2675109 RepID=A0ABY2QC46_9HYPH|nr:hypothetical protein [Mesorhizobium composti]THF59864.1 hypothetical protein E6C48_02100 [Mesorhizobium composti]